MLRLKDNDFFAFSSEGKLSAPLSLIRIIFTQLGEMLATAGVLSKGISSESFAEIRIYVEKFSEDFYGIYRTLPENIFNTPLKKVMQLELQYWEKLLGASESNPQFDLDIDEYKACFIPTGIVGDNSFLNFRELCVPTQKLLPKVNSPEHIPTICYTRRGFFYGFGYNTLGPVFCAYALWMLQQSPKSYLWGLMREGKFLARVSAELGGKIGGNLHISRLTSIKAAMADPDDQQVLINFLFRSRTDLLKMNDALIHMGVSEYKELPISIGSYISSENLSRVLEWVDSPMIKEQRLAHSKDIMGGLLAHLDMADVPASEDLVLLDLGYAGNILANLNSVFKYVGRNQVCRGRFLLSSVGSVWAQKKGCEILGCLTQNGAPYDFSSLYFRTPELLELCCSTESGTTVGYDNGNPVCEKAPLPTQQYVEIKSVQEGIVQFIKNWKDEKNFSRDRSNHKDLSQMKQLAYMRLTRLFDDPTKDEAQKLGSWLYDHSPAGDLYGLTEPRFKGLDPNKASRTELYWPQAHKVIKANA